MALFLQYIWLWDLTKRRSILQIRNYFPNAKLEKINSWKGIKEKISGISIDKEDSKSFEIGEDSASKQAVRKRHYEQKKSLKRGDTVTSSHLRDLYDVVELQKNPTTRKTGLTSHIFNCRPDLIRVRHQGIKLAKELAKERRTEKLIKIANSVKWRDWQHFFIRKATLEERNPREILVVYDPEGNTGKSYLSTMFSLLYPDKTCSLQNGKSRNMFYSTGKVDDLK